LTSQSPRASRDSRYSTTQHRIKNGLFQSVGPGSIFPFVSQTGGRFDFYFYRAKRETGQKTV
jgi:hypothetical protein